MSRSGVRRMTSLATQDLIEEVALKATANGQRISAEQIAKESKRSQIDAEATIAKMVRSGLLEWDGFMSYDGEQVRAYVAGGGR